MKLPLEGGTKVQTQKKFASSETDKRAKRKVPFARASEGKYASKQARQVKSAAGTWEEIEFSALNAFSARDLLSTTREGGRKREIRSLCVGAARSVGLLAHANQQAKKQSRLAG